MFLRHLPPISSATGLGTSCPLGAGDLPGEMVPFGAENSPETAEQASEQEKETVVSTLVQKNATEPTLGLI